MSAERELLQRLVDCFIFDDSGPGCLVAHVTARAAVDEARALLAQPEDFAQQLFNRSTADLWREYCALKEERDSLLARRERKPQWSDQPPSVPGWYWWREIPGADLAAIEVLQDSSGLFVMTDDCSMPMPEGGQWAGPITPPEE